SAGGHSPARAGPEVAEILDHGRGFHCDRRLRSKRCQQLLVGPSERSFQLVQHLKDAEDPAVQVQKRRGDEVTRLVASLRVHPRVKALIACDVGNIDELPGRGYGWAHQSVAARAVHLSTLNVEHDASCDPRNGCRWLRMRGVETIGEPFSKRTLLLTRPRATSNPGPGHREPPARSHSPRRRAAGNVPESPVGVEMTI